MIHNVFNPIMFRGGVSLFPPFPGINPKVSCNENSKGKIYDENTSKKIFFLTILPHPSLSPPPTPLTIPHLKVDPRIFQQNFYYRIFLGKKYFKVKFFLTMNSWTQKFHKTRKNFNSIFLKPKFKQANNFIGRKKICPIIYWTKN